MADQIAIQLPRTKWNEGSAFTLTAYFRDRATNAADTPTTIHYRLDCLTTGTELADWTSVSAAGNISLSITGTHNAIQSDANRYETKQLTLMADKDLSTQYRESVTWRVSNLYGSP